MPRKFLFTREEIVAAAVDITREGGIEAVTARSLGAKLGSSSKPIFSLFENMDAVQCAVIAAADELYKSYLESEIKSGMYPPYKASGMAYIRFAREEKELFKLLFMRDRSHERIDHSHEQIAPLLEMIRRGTGLGEDEAYLFHMEMWVYVHGIATMIATNYLDWDTELVSRTLTDVYFGLQSRFLSEKA